MPARAANDETVLAALSRVLEVRDPGTRGHAERVSALAELVAERLGWDDERREKLRLGARLHDIGKVVVPGSILRKPGPLDATELIQIRRHPQAGARFVAPLARARPALPCVLYHHERWEGGGYPAGLAGRAIPAEARVLAVADAYDAMTSRRPYRPPVPPIAAVGEVERCAGTQFDPELARVFVEVWESGAIAPHALAV